MIKYGLKIWSINNESLFKEAIRLFENKKIDFVELYIVPGSLKPEILENLKNISTTLHAPHMEHGFDVFKLDDLNIEIWKNQVIKTADFLNSKFIVVHAEVGDSKEIFLKNIKKIYDNRILIENLPKFGIEGDICFCHSYEQLKFIKDSGLNFCLDFSHAIMSAIGYNLDYKEFIEKLIFELNPIYFHICNGKINTKKDEHGNLFEGDFDIKWIKKTLLKLAEKKDIYLVFETPKGDIGLENDIKNINYFKDLK